MTFPATVDSTFLKIKSDYWFFFKGLLIWLKLKTKAEYWLV